jgi:tetratricopeptide (TPR) repeat protein
MESDYEPAIADFSKVIELNPGFPEDYNNRAWAYLKVGKAERGLADVARGLQLTTNDAHVWDTGGHIYEAMGRKDDAVSSFRKALALDPSLRSSREALDRLKASP